MSFTTGITDRSAIDLVNKTSKGYINISDWSRIYANGLYLNGLFNTFLGVTIPWTTISTPTYTTDGTAAMFNTLLTNIKNLWSYYGLTITGIIEPKTDYIGGPGSVAPTYIDINNWETDLALLYAFILVANKARQPRTGLAHCGASLTSNNKFRGA